MENLVKNISRLIAQHNCVIIPGVGAFLAHRVPACYNAKERVFMPPHRALVFNPQVTVDDALLLSEYMDDGTMSYEEAGECLANDIEAMRQKLSATGILCFGDLGTFNMDIEGKISFTANENSIDDPYNYGFEPLAIAPLKELQQKDIVIKRSNIGKYISAIAAAIVVIFVLIPLGSSIYNRDTQLSVAGFTPVEKGARTVTVVAPASESVCEIAPVEETVTAHIFTTTDAPAPTLSPVEKKAEVEPAAPAVEENVEIAEEISKQYSIIVASTPNSDKAQLAITELSRKMQADYQVVQGDRRFRIAIESYSNEADANAALERIQATFSDAWIYIH